MIKFIDCFQIIYYEMNQNHFLIVFLLIGSIVIHQLLSCLILITFNRFIYFNILLFGQNLHFKYRYLLQILSIFYHLSYFIKMDFMN